MINYFLKIHVNITNIKNSMRYVTTHIRLMVVADPYLDSKQQTWDPDKQLFWVLERLILLFDIQKTCYMSAEKSQSLI